ncbi:MAG: ABC transporter permease [Parvibaculaceae bacterium]|nr:ABC transporter permease [Parvibaculaceae bacterium]
MKNAVLIAARSLAIFAGFLMLWQAAISLFAIPPYLLPGPADVAAALWTGRASLWSNMLVTLAEILLGLGFGVLVGAATALAMTAVKPLRRWLMPVLIVSQAIPIFALAPLLVLWFGFGMASKVIAAMLVIYFPVTATFFDGLRRTGAGLLDLADTMNASPTRILWHVRLPAALPAFGSGLRVAAAVAPIGAIIGEWVGSAGGLGFVMLNANARLQTDMVFAALFVLALLAVALWAIVDRLVKWLIFWPPETGQG